MIPLKEKIEDKESIFTIGELKYKVGNRLESIKKEITKRLRDS